MKKTALLIICLIASVAYGLVPSEITKVEFACNGSTTTFNCTGSNKIICYASTDIEIHLVNDTTAVPTLLTETTHYSLSALNNDFTNGFTITTVSTYASGNTLVAVQAIDRTQDLNLIRGRAIPAEDLESTLDKYTLWVQLLKMLFDGSIHRPISESGTTMEIPNVVDRANKYLACDAEGGIIASSGPTGDSSIPVSAFMETLLDDASASASMRTLHGIAVINVKGPPYNAKGDGVTDDTAAIQAALDAMSDGDRLEFPPGEYNTNAALTFGARHYCRISGYGATIESTSTGNILTFGNDLSYATQWNLIEGLYFHSETAICGIYVTGRGTYNNSFRELHIKGKATPVANSMGMCFMPTNTRCYLNVITDCYMENWENNISLGRDFNTSTAISDAYAPNANRFDHINNYGHSVYGLYIENTHDTTYAGSFTHAPNRTADIRLVDGVGDSYINTFHDSGSGPDDILIDDGCQVNVIITQKGDVNDLNVPSRNLILQDSAGHSTVKTESLYVRHIHKQPGTILTVHNSMQLNEALFLNAITITAEGPTDDVDVGECNVIYIDTSSNNVTVGGFQRGAETQVLYIVIIDKTNNVTMEHNEAGNTQKMFLSSGADETITASYGGWTFIRNGSHWYEVDN